MNWTKIGDTIKTFPDTLMATQNKPLNAAGYMLSGIDAAGDLEDLSIPSGNRLEALAGDRPGLFSLRIHEKWRVCFACRQENVKDVERVDDHGGEMMSGGDFYPVLSGETGMEELLKPMGIRPYRLAERIHVPARRIHEIVPERRGVTAEQTYGG